MSVILGLNFSHAGSSATIVIDGKPVVSIAEERLNRKKYYARFPVMSVKRCLDISGVGFGDVDLVAVGRDGSANLTRKAQYALSRPGKMLKLLKMRGHKSEMDDIKTIFGTAYQIDPAGLRFKQVNVEHHLAHIASSYLISEWDKAAGISIDGSGDFVTGMLADCEGDQINIKHRVFVPHSLGWLYTMICQFIGYGKYGDEGKVMGLAPYGKDTYKEQFDDMVRFTDKGFTLNSKYFLPLESSDGMTIDDEGSMVVHRLYSDLMVKLFGKPRHPDNEMTQRDMDLAFGVQAMFERIYMHLLAILHALVPVERAAMSGGCALNSVANGKLFDETPFTQTCIQPAAGDEGLSMGAALYVSRCLLGEGDRFVMKHACWGPEFTEQEIRRALDAARVNYTRCDREQLLDETADEMMKGNVIGWFQGRMEWGPRALGNRSIVVHPGLPDMKDTLNARIKRREWYRPFAPSVLAERQADIFEHTHPSPFMLHVYKIKPEWRERLCAVNHVDNTGRLQSVMREENPLYHDLIAAFERKSGIPVVLNTSFNENEPIVCEPSEAIDCFLRTKMDVLVIGPFICRKSES